MVVDSLAHAELYARLSPRFRTALAWLAAHDLTRLSLGRHDIAGDELFALVQEYETKVPSAGRWEAHRRYADIQLVPVGVERIGVAALEQMRVDVPYEESKDVGFFFGTGDWITLAPGRFAIFFPQDVHLPCLQQDGPVNVRKVVVKVQLSDNSPSDGASGI
ncbi:MAG: YhcH/YjgK/YiaL family protein [Pirellulales bacterium]